MPRSLSTFTSARTLIGCMLAWVIAALAPAFAEETEPATGPVYVALEPEFTINYGQEGRLRYLQTAVTLQASDNAAALDVNIHSDAIRHEIIMMISEQSGEEIRSAQSRKAMQEQLLERIRSLLEEETGRPLVENVLFTAFVVQS